VNFNVTEYSVFEYSDYLIQSVAILIEVISVILLLILIKNV